MKKACLLCDRSPLEIKTGCLIENNSKIIAEGWNKSSDVHAEVMCINSVADKSHLRETVLYVTRFPCDLCAKEIISAGIHKIFFMSDHFTSNNSALALFEEARIPVIQITEDVVWRR